MFEGIGSGNVPEKLKHYIRKLTEDGILVVITQASPFKDASGEYYGPQNEIYKAGGISSGDIMHPEMKAALATGHAGRNLDRSRKIFLTPYMNDLHIDKLPENCSLEGIQYTLYVRSKIEIGQMDIEEGNLLTHDEVKSRTMKTL